MFKKITHSVMALALVTGLMTVNVPKADAHDGRGVAVGVAAGLIGLGILGAAANARGRYYADDRCYYGPRECHYTGRRCFENSYGDTVCRGGRYVCDRPLICD
jgi:hypothetical protein